MTPKKVHLKELEGWLTPAEAGRVLGMSKQAMLKRLESGKHRAAKTRQGWLVDPQSVEEYAKRGG